nr:PREDICTED: uncharacterized protein LOC105272767 [Fopius arisanus]
MLERFLQLEEYIPGITRKCRKTKFTNLLSQDQIEILSEVVELMKPIELVIREISGGEYPTWSVIIPIIVCLKATLKVMIPTRVEGMHFQAKLLRKITDKFEGVENNKILAISTILNPRLKKLHFEYARTAANAISCIDSEMKSTGVRAIQENTIVQRKPEDSNKVSLWKTHDDFASKSTDESSADEHLTYELRQYTFIYVWM